MLLIKCADTVVNFNPSIGTEALLQETTLVNPGYPHDSTTIFDETSAVINTSSNEDNIEAVKRCHRESGDLIPEERKEASCREVVYGWRDGFDVLDAHRNLLREKANIG